MTKLRLVLSLLYFCFFFMFGEVFIVCFISWCFSFVLLRGYKGRPLGPYISQSCIWTVAHICSQDMGASHSHQGERDSGWKWNSARLSELVLFRSAAADPLLIPNLKIHHVEVMVCFILVGFVRCLIPAHIRNREGRFSAILYSKQTQLKKRQIICLSVGENRPRSKKRKQTKITWLLSVWSSNTQNIVTQKYL